VAAAPALTPVARRLLSDEVHDRLLGEVIAGRLAPGDALPSERALSEGLRVNRHAVREALKRLQQAGLVQVSQGGSTRVRDWRRSAGLDLLGPLVASARGPARRELLLHVARMRTSVGADVARLCALASSRPLLSPVPAGLPFSERADLYAAFWEAMVDGAGNLAYRLAFNSLIAAQHHGPIDPRIHAAEIDDGRAQEALAAAVAAGDGDRAAALARDLLDRTVAALESPTDDSPHGGAPAP
jgi:DNA-binding FadR family transcriptional regulator